MGWHQAVRRYIHAPTQILPDAVQEIKVISALEKHALPVVAAVIEVVILIR
jgi:hypothetical protein